MDLLEHSPVSASDAQALAALMLPFQGDEAEVFRRSAEIICERVRRGGVTALLAAVRALDTDPSHLDLWRRTQHLTRTSESVSPAVSDVFADVLAAALIARALPQRFHAAAEVLAAPLREIHLLAHVHRSDPSVFEVLATLALDAPAAPLEGLLFTARHILYTPEHTQPER